MQYGSSLAGWTAAVHQGAGPDEITITETPDGHDTAVVTIALPASFAAGGKLFVRLNVAVAAP